MSRRPATVTQADVARAIRAVEQTNYPAVVEIDRDGTIRIVPAKLALRTKLSDANNDDEPIEL
jgi:hypothetical protein